MDAAQARMLPDGKRLHLQHGPIDLILGGEGPGLGDGFSRAIRRFRAILPELVSELKLIRRPYDPGVTLSGPVALAMQKAVAPFAGQFVTPMAAVAGAVADEILSVLVDAGDMRQAYVNNGGDVALYLAAGQQMSAAIGEGPGDRIVIPSDSPVRGVATSGWRGRSFSLGIADHVTVLARNGATADAAATLIANAVDLPDSPKIIRRPAGDLAPDSDLGQRPVTVGVNDLSDREIARALDRGAEYATACLEKNLICAALVMLSGERRMIGRKPLESHPAGALCNA